MYSERLLQYFREPKWVGALPPPAVQAEEIQPVCGDILRLSLRFENDRVAEAAFQAKGCTASIAAGAALADWAIGKSKAELRSLTPAAIEDLLDGLPAESKHAALLAVDVARKICR